MSQLHSSILPFLGVDRCPWSNLEARTKHDQPILQNEGCCIIEDCWYDEEQKVNECIVSHAWSMTLRIQATLWQSLWVWMAIICLSLWKVYQGLHCWTHSHVQVDKSRILQCSKDRHKANCRIQYRFSRWRLESFQLVLLSLRLKRKLVAQLRNLIFPTILQFRAILLSFQASWAQLRDIPIYM